jgi:hypothetical protein
MNALETLTEKAGRNPEQAVTLADLKVLIQELKEQAQWIESSNRVLSARLQRIQRKTDSAYVFGSNEGAIRQELSELQKQQKTMQQVIQKLMYRS